MVKPQNNKDIWKAYRVFSLYLAGSVSIAVLIYSFYINTSIVEVDRILAKTEESDKIVVQQIELTQKIDSLYAYTAMFNTNLNDGLLLNAVSKRKQDVLTDIEKLNAKDAKLYHALMQEINIFLSVKDSIRLLRIEEDLVKTDLQKCMDNNKNAMRSINLGKIGK